MTCRRSWWCTYDLTGSQYGVMLVPDQAQALREMVRVTKPGGRVLLIAYGNPDKFEALHFFIGAVQAVVPEFEGPAEDEPLLAHPHRRPCDSERRGLRPNRLVLPRGACGAHVLAVSGSCRGRGSTVEVATTCR
jgi:SAM-dependent methyltransferase